MKYDIVENNIKIENKIIYCVDKDIISIIHSLEQENQELKEKQNYDLKWALKYDELYKENQELKKQLEENKNPLKGIFSQVNDDMLLRNCGAMQSEIDTYKNQQKEFIEYLENMLDNENDMFSVVRVKDVLSKYEEIIGGK